VHAVVGRLCRNRCPLVWRDVGRAVIYTAKITYCGPLKAIDVSRGTGSGPGLAFAPSWALLRGFLEQRKRLDRAEQEAAIGAGGEGLGELKEQFKAAFEKLWADYREAYLSEMRASYKTDRMAWDWLARLAQSEDIVLLCYCAKKYADLGHCHRIILGAEILTKLGLQYGGEASIEHQSATVGGRIRRGKRKSYKRYGCVLGSCQG